MEQLKNIQQVVDDIKSITIQWATNIAKAAFEILISESKNKSFESWSAFLDFIQQGMELLISARPTEPMLFNGMDYIKSEIKKLTPAASAQECQQKVQEAAQFYLNLINETAERAVLNGLGIINEEIMFLRTVIAPLLLKLLNFIKSKVWSLKSTILKRDLFFSEERQQRI